MYYMYSIDPFPVHRLKFKVRFRRVARRNPLPKMKYDWKRGHPTIYIYGDTHTYLYLYSYWYIHVVFLFIDMCIYIFIHGVYASKLFIYTQKNWMILFLQFVPPQMGFFFFKSLFEVSEHQQAKPPVDSSFLDLKRGSGEPSFALLLGPSSLMFSEMAT